LPNPSKGLLQFRHEYVMLMIGKVVKIHFIYTNLFHKGFKVLKRIIETKLKEFEIDYEDFEIAFRAQLTFTCHRSYIAYWC